MSYSDRAEVQHGRARRRAGSLLHPAAGTIGPAVDPGIDRGQALLRAACAPSDRQDVRSARVARPAQQRRRGGLPLRVRERRGRPGRARRRAARHAGHSGGTGLPSPVRGRRVPLRHLAGHIGDLRRGCAGRGAYPLVREHRGAGRAADRRGRHPDRRHTDRRAATVAGALRSASRELPPERSAMRRARRARLPDSVECREHGDSRRQRIQRPGRTAASGRFQRGRGARVAGPAHQRDGPAIHAGGPGDGLAADSGAAVAGERALPSRLLRRAGGP